VLKACIKGARSRDAHPALPATPGELARDVAAVAALRVDAVHLHVKDARGVDTLDARALAGSLSAAREVAPGLPLGVTTGAWALTDSGARVAAVRSWSGLRVLPGFASVNWHESGADGVAAALLDFGMGVEAGLWHVDGALAWLASPYRHRCLRVLLELPDGLDAADVDAAADDLLQLLGQDPRVATSDVPVLLHGEGTSA
jgi:uncharacterized protein (DUF849 family)